MRLEKIRIRNLGPFRDRTIDLTELPPNALLVAVCGENGAGKSTLLELATGGALYRHCETRGSLVDLATERDAALEVTLVNGHRWTLRHSADCISGKSESVVIGEDGQPAIASVKVRDFDAWSASTLPAPEILYSSLVAVQGSEGFLGAKPGDRKAILLRSLGVERLERLAADARERARAAQGTVDTLAARIGDEKARSGDAAEAQAVLATARQEAAKAAEQASAARAALESARIEAASAAARHEAYRTALAARQRIAQELATVQAQADRLDDLERQRAAATGDKAHAERVRDETLADLTSAKEAAAVAEAERETYRVASEARSRIAAKVEAARLKLEKADELVARNRQLLADAPAIREAVAKVEEIRAEQAAAEAEAEAAERDAAAERLAENAALENALREEGLSAAAEKRANAARARLADAEKVRAAAASLEELRSGVQSKETELADSRGLLEELRGRTLVGAEDRIADLRETLAEIHDSSDSTAGALRTLAGSALERDDFVADEAKGVPLQITQREVSTRAAEDALAVAQRRLFDAEALAARLPDIEAAERDLATAEAEQKKHEGEEERYRSEAMAHATNAQKHFDRAAEVGARADSILVPDDIAALAAKAQHLAGAEERLSLREASAAEARDALDALRVELAETPEPMVPEEPDYAGLPRLERLAKAAAEEHEGHVREIARIGELILAAQAAAERVPTLQSELDANPEPSEPAPAPELDVLDGKLKWAEKRATDASAAVTRAEEALRSATEAAARISDLEAQLSAASSELADWTLLGRDLGRDGLQAALVDSACAELTALCNDLLHEAFGPRWSVSFETQRLDAKGKRQLEGMDVRVLDTERGRDDFVESYSGGERTVLGEAVSLALTVLACRRYGFDRPTLVRDETSAALDPEKAVAYVAMLRRAATMLGADRVLLVSHSPEVQELCDARIELP